MWSLKDERRKIYSPEFTLPFYNKKNTSDKNVVA